MADVVFVLRNIWMPERGVPATSLSDDDGPQFTATVVRSFCETWEIVKPIILHTILKGILLLNVICAF